MFILQVKDQQVKDLQVTGVQVAEGCRGRGELFSPSRHARIDRGVSGLLSMVCALMISMAAPALAEDKRADQSQETAQETAQRQVPDTASDVAQDAVQETAPDQAQEAGQEMTFPVVLEPLVKRALPATISIMGRLEPEPRQLYFRTGGNLVHINAEAGQRVAAGEVLASLDTLLINNEIATNRAELEHARRNLDRMKNLLKGNYAAQSRADDARLAVQKHSLHKSTLEERLARHFLHAPVAGTILKRHLDHAKPVTTGDAIFSFMADEKPWRITAWLRARELETLVPGQAVIVNLPDLPPPAQFSARVEQIAAHARAGDGLFKADFTLTEKDARLRAGLRVRLNLPKRGGQRGQEEGGALGVRSRVAYRVPLKALRRMNGLRGELYLVTAQQPDMANRVPVTFQNLRDGHVTVTTDLAAYSHVVVRGQHNLSERSKIQALTE